MTVSSPTANRPARSERVIWPALIVVATFVICAVRLVGFVQDNAVNLIFDDQWDFLNPLFAQQGPIACFFYQHGPPRMGLGNLIDWYLYAATAWDVRAVSWVAVGVLVVATLAGIALMVRVRGRLSWVDAGIPLLVLGPIHWESMTMTPSVGPMILPLLLTVLTAYAWTSAHRWRRVLGVGCCVSLNLFTGYGICSLPAVIGLALLYIIQKREIGREQERVDALVISIIIAIAVTVFSVGYKWAPNVPGWRFPVSNGWDYPRFCSLMFASLLGLRFISPLSVSIGAVLLLGLAGILSRDLMQIWRKASTPAAGAVWILAGTSLTYVILTAVGRLPISIEAAFMWRYSTLLVPGLLAFAVFLESGGMGGPRIYPQVVWIILVLAVWCNFGPEHQAGAIAKAKRAWIGSYLKTHDLSAANRDSGFWVYYPDPNSPRIAERLRWLEERHLSFFRR